MRRWRLDTMPNYNSVCHWTSSGTEKLKDSPTLLDAAKKTFAESGVKILNFYMTMGKYDMVIVFDAPSDEALAKAMLAMLAKGTITAHTSRAFNEDEYRKILGSLS